MTWKAQVGGKVIETTLQYQIFVCHWVIYFGFWPRIRQNPYCSIYSAKIWWPHCHVLFECIVMIFFTNWLWYYLTSCKNLERLNVIFMVRKMGQLFKILIIPSFRLILMTSLWRCLWLLLSRIFFHELTLVLFYSIPKFVKIACHLHGWKIGKKKSMGGGVATPSTITLSNFLAKTICPIWKIFWWTDASRMGIQLKILFQIKALPIPEKNWKKNC